MGIGGQFLSPEDVIEQGYYAFIILDHKFPTSINLIAYYDDYYLVDWRDVAILLTNYKDFIIYSVFGVREAEFALILINFDS
jgi:hypothetical protein